MSIISGEALIKYPEIFQIIKELPWNHAYNFLRLVRSTEIQLHERERLQWVQEQIRSYYEEILIPLIPTMQHNMLDHLARKFTNCSFYTELNWVTFALFLEKPEFLTDVLSFNDLEALDHSLSEGRGVILAIMHSSTYSAIPAILAAKNYIVNAIAEEKSVPGLKEVMEKYLPQVAQRISVLSVPDMKILLKCLHRLKKNEIVCIYPEISEGVKAPHTYVKFLGKEIYAPEGPAYLAAMSGAELIPTLLIQDGDDPLHCQLILGDPIKVIKREPENLRQALVELFKQFEHFVMKFPDQWLGWGFFHERMVVHKDIKQREVSSV